MGVLGRCRLTGLVSRLLKGEISARHAPIAAMLLSLFAADFAWTCMGVGPASGWHSVGDLLVAPRAWRALADLFLVAACGGVFSVPLYAIVQEWSDPRHRARMIAATNVLNAACMVAGAAVLAALAGREWMRPPFLWSQPCPLWAWRSPRGVCCVAHRRRTACFRHRRAATKRRNE